MAVADGIITEEVLVAEEVSVGKEVSVVKEEVLAAAVSEANEAAAREVVASVRERIPVLAEEVHLLPKEKVAFHLIGHLDVLTHQDLKVFRIDQRVARKNHQNHLEQEDREKANICLLIF